MKQRSLRGELNVNSPCRDCDERSVLCHAECDRYLEYQRKNAEIREKRREYDGIIETINRGEIRRKITRKRRNTT